MSRRADAALFTRIQTLRSDARQLANDLRAYGDGELSTAVSRALSELNHPSLTGAENTLGVNADAYRK